MKTYMPWALLRAEVVMLLDQGDELAAAERLNRQAMSIGRAAQRHGDLELSRRFYAAAARKRRKEESAR